MKKLSLKVAAVVAFVAVAGYGVYSSQKSNITMSELALANVEALAGNEGGGLCHTNSDYTAICNYYDNGAVCPCGF